MKLTLQYFIYIIILPIILTSCSTSHLLTGEDLSPKDGADSYHNCQDHASSPYYKYPDFYSASSNHTLTILPHYQGFLQTTEWFSPLLFFNLFTPPKILPVQQH